MNLEKTLIDAGADCVAGHLILDRKRVGSYVDGAFVASEDGLDFVAPESKVAKPAAGKSKPAKPNKHEDAASGDQDELDDMLGE